MLLLDRETVSGDCQCIGYQRFVLLNCLIDSKGSCNILYHSAYVDRKSHGLNLAFHHSVDELFLSALRVFFLERHHFDAVIAFCSFLKSSKGLIHHPYCLRLVLLDSDDCAASAEDLLHDCRADDDFLAPFEHDAVVGSKVRLALCAIENQALSLLARRRAELHVCREGRTAESDDSVQFYLVENRLVV